MDIKLMNLKTNKEEKVKQKTKEETIGKIMIRIIK